MSFTEGQYSVIISVFRSSNHDSLIRQNVCGDNVPVTPVTSRGFTLTPRLGQTYTYLSSHKPQTCNLSMQHKLVILLPSYLPCLCASAFHKHRHFPSSFAISFNNYLTSKHFVNSRFRMGKMSMFCILIMKGQFYIKHLT